MFENIIGQQKARDIIAGQLASGRVPHAYLFIGPEGTGRRKVAIELAKALNCSYNTPEAGATAGSGPCNHCVSCSKIERGIHPDVQLIDLAFQARLEGKDLDKQKALKIDTVRALQKDVNLKPSEARWKIYIVEPAEKLTLDAANSLLKTLEEPPEYTVIILLAQHKEDLPRTVVSRTQIVPFAPLQKRDVVEFLIKNAAIGEVDARDIAELAEGSLSRALALAQGGNDVYAELWSELCAGRKPTHELLAISSQYGRSADELFDEFLAYARRDFRADPYKHRKSMALILTARAMIEKNVNPQMVLDDTLIKLNLLYK